MTLVLELPDSQKAALNEKAQARGLSLEDYAYQVLTRELQPEADRQPFWKAFTQRMESLPDDVFDQLPTDSASQHDHYFYGSPKRF